MRFKIFALITILSFSILINACGGSEQPPANNAASNKPANTTNTTNNAGNAVTTTKTPEAATSNNAPTLAPVVAAYYEAWKKKDDASLRKIFSQETLKAFEADMKADKKTSLSEWFSYNEELPEKPFEVRNEKIEGNTAIAELKGGSYAVWTKFKFVKENGEWKMTNETPEISDVKNAANTANSAK